MKLFRENGSSKGAGTGALEGDRPKGEGLPGDPVGGGEKGVMYSTRSSGTEVFRLLRLVDPRDLFSGVSSSDFTPSVEGDLLFSSIDDSTIIASN